MHELLQIRIPVGKRKIIFFHLLCRTLLLVRAQKHRKASIRKGPLELLVQTSVMSQGHRLGYSGRCQAK